MLSTQLLTGKEKYNDREGDAIPADAFHHYPDPQSGCNAA